MAGRIRQPGFTLHLDDAGQWLRSRVVWLGTRQPPRGLLQLANMLRAQAARQGCYQSPQPFHPHITLLRDAGQAVAIPPPGFHWGFPGELISRCMNPSLHRDAPAIRRYSAGRWATPQGILMKFSPALQSATLIQRYKRFLADVMTPEGEALTLHCPNTGAMTGCATPGDTVWYSTSENTKRKYAHTWEITANRARGHLFALTPCAQINWLRKRCCADAIPELSG